MHKWYFQIVRLQSSSVNRLVKFSDCKYKRLSSVVIDEGDLINSYNYLTPGECRDKCDKTERCFNVRYCPESRICSLHKNKLNGKELQYKVHGGCYTSFKQCKYFIAYSLSSEINEFKYPCQSVTLIHYYHFRFDSSRPQER